MSKYAFHCGDFIKNEDGRNIYELKQPAEFNNKYYVVPARDLESGKDCLLKFVPADDNMYKINNLTREGNFRFCYPYIEKVYGNFKGKDPDGDAVFGVSVEFIEGKDLLEYRPALDREMEEKIISPAEKEKIILRQMLQFLQGMNYYTQFDPHTYLHRDLRPENVRITKKGDVKIIDFDFAHIAGSDKTMRVQGWDLGFSTGYASPEVFSYGAVKKSPDLTCEIYSAGRVLFYWLNGRHYYPADQVKIAYDPKTDLAIPEETPYCKEETLRYGIKANADRFEPIYLGDRYVELRSILHRMCCDPSAEKPYHSVAEIITDMKNFLMDYCGGSAERYEEWFGTERMQVLSDSHPREFRRGRMVAYKVKGVRYGKPLYEYSLRDVMVEGHVLLMLCNLESEISFIPVPGVELAHSRLIDGEYCRINEEDYRIQNGDRLTWQGIPMEFTIGRKI